MRRHLVMAVRHHLRIQVVVRDREHARFQARQAVQHAAADEQPRQDQGSGQAERRNRQQHAPGLDNRHPAAFPPVHSSMALPQYFYKTLNE